MDGAMDTKAQSAFIVSIFFQCKLIELAARDVINGLEAGEQLRGPPADENVQVWYGLQNLLVAMSVISKLLWRYNTARKLNALDRAELRKTLGVTEHSCFKDKGRLVRNGFEHLDERLEEWWALGSKRTFSDMNITDSIAKMGFPPGSRDQLRTFDTSTRNIHFWGDVVNFDEIVEEARILQRACAEKVFPGLKELHDDITRLNAATGMNLPVPKGFGFPA